MAAKNSAIKRLEQTTFKLRALLNITLAINENLSQEDLLNHYVNLLQKDLDIGKLILFKLEDNWKCILNRGYSEEFICKIDVEKDLLQFDEISFDWGNSKESNLGTYDIVVPVQHKGSPIAYVIIGDIDEDTEGVSPIIKHLNFIQTLSNIIIVAIENIRLFNESLRQEAMRKELELASKMQSMLIPDQNILPKNDKVFMAAFYHPHLEVGGDYYDYIELSKDEIGFCISDVSGKGISAAILMSNFQANLRALFTHEISLSALIEKLNERVINSANGEKFITLFVAKYNFKTRELEYINAGHNQPLLYRKDVNELTFLDKGCVGIGMLDEIPLVRKGSITIEGNAKLLCYTDGLVELMDGKGISFGTGEIEACLMNPEPIQKNIDEIIEMQGILEGSAKIFDDISILGVEIF
ncbi:MAG: SpoIIE family protein phosphatase [Bacteroidales bacterium]|nr:SpoIIE family protein phosphatase [Bacteroidales bacterium]MBN2819122.1 SpoIIE family protein phosphatase [Bacteroidales bacterium]